MFLRSMFLRKRQSVISLCFLFLASIFGVPQSGAAQQPQISVKRLAVDSVEYRKHTFLGLILNDGAKDGEFVIAVDRKWLAKTYPKQMEAFENEEADFLGPVLDQYDARMDEWVNEQKDRQDVAQILGLEKERIRFENSGAQLKQKKFILLRFAKADVKSIHAQPFKRKRIAALAWSSALEAVTIRPLKELVQELEKDNVDVENEPFNLSSYRPAVKLTDREWNIRKAMYEFWNFGKMEFQGEGETLFDKSDANDIGKVISTMMGGSSASQIEKLGRELGLPEFTQPAKNKPKDEWKTKLTKKADAAGVRSIMVKRIIDSNRSDQVVVEAVFMAKVSDAKWETVKTIQSTARFADQTDADIAALDGDAQVKKAIGALKSMGLADDSMVRTALQRGAATQTALRNVTDDMNLILDRNSRDFEYPITLN